MEPDILRARKRFPYLFRRELIMDRASVSVEKENQVQMEAQEEIC